MQCINRTLSLSSGIIGLLVSAAHAAPEPQGFQWIDEPGEYRELRDGDKPVLRYMYHAYDESSPEARERTYKPYHHVFSPDGTTLLTKGPGGLFPHHRGLFYGFNKITYGDGRKCDTWHCPDHACQTHEEFLEEEAGDHSAHHKVVVNWHGQEGEVFAREEREIAVERRDGGVLIDFRSHLEPVDVDSIHLDGDPQHAGFQFRAAQEVAAETAKQTYYLRTDGKGELGETRNWNHQNQEDPINSECANRPWNAMSFVVDGKRYTALYMDHPSNPKPSRYSERDYGRFGSYFVADVTKDKPLDVQYRVWVQDGEMTVEDCEKLSTQFMERSE
ncbi:MAG: DUF6807 family protein [Pirellulales bacterium]